MDIDIYVLTKKYQKLARWVQFTAAYKSISML